MSYAYPPPVDQLLTYGDPRHSRAWSNYLELGLTQKHIPDLMRMATDDKLHWANSEQPEVWASLHAWRALGQLHAEDAMAPLLSLLQMFEEDDWVGEELPTVFGMIGPKALPALADYLADAAHGLYPRITAAYSLERLGTTHPGVRGECIAVLSQQLERGTANDPTLNGFLVSYLVDLRAVNTIASIRKAFEQDCVDCTVVGDFQDVQIDLDLLPRRLTPPVYPTLYDTYVGRTPTSSAQTKPTIPKVGRNDPCPCDSGKKYKKCCLNKRT